MTRNPSKAADKAAAARLPTFAKCPTGIRGLDEITGGGIPGGRPTLVCGGAGSGKTLLGLEFLVRGIKEFEEPGVFMCFEEREQDLAENVASLGFDLTAMIAHNKLIIDQVTIDRDEIFETGEYNLDGLFIRLGAAIDAVGAKRVVLDTIEALFAALTNLHILRAELRRLFQWLKDKGVTAIITGERGGGALTRNGLEEYVSDCVILLDQKVDDEVATRRLRVVKYRGSAHGTNEYPFLIDEHGFTVLPITNINLQYAVSEEIVSTGIPTFDAMFAGGGYFRGGTLLVSGSAGTGKSSIAASFSDAACRRGERCLYFAFEEAPDQIVRDMRSIGIDLRKWIDNGRLHIVSTRPASFGLESHLSAMVNKIDELKPRIVVLDPVSSFQAAGTSHSARAMLMRLVDLLKARQVTAMFISLTGAGHAAEQSETRLSSLIDTWVMVRNLEQAGERSRTLSLIKSRGMKHSNQTRELLLTDGGIELVDIVVGPDGDIMTGSARAAQEIVDCAAAAALKQDFARKKDAMARKREATEAKIAEMNARLVDEAEDLDLAIAQQTSTRDAKLTARAEAAMSREVAGRARTGHSNGGAR